jgi:CubicO group peptidase (beta-lactamase class C family)
LIPLLFFVLGACAAETETESGALLDVESGFELASVSKTFTAVAIHQLVEGGKLDYEDALPKFLPDLPYSAVTIRGLLSHTSGLFDVYERDDLRAEFYEFYGKTDPPYSNKDYLAFLEEFKPDLDNEPFVEDRYSNTGFVLLALIVEEVSGEEFECRTWNSPFSDRALETCCGTPPLPFPEEKDRQTQESESKAASFS